MCLYMYHVFSDVFNIQSVWQSNFECQLHSTPPKINMEPENDGLEDYFPFQLGDF